MQNPATVPWIASAILIVGCDSGTDISVSRSFEDVIERLREYFNSKLSLLASLRETADQRATRFNFYEDADELRSVETDVVVLRTESEPTRIRICSGRKEEDVVGTLVTRNAETERCRSDEIVYLLGSWSRASNGPNACAGM